MERHMVIYTQNNKIEFSNFNLLKINQRKHGI